MIETIDLIFTQSHSAHCEFEWWYKNGFSFKNNNGTRQNVYERKENSSDVRNRSWVMCPPEYNQSSEILSCSNGIGTKLSNTIDLEASSGSVCGGTSSRMRSGLIDNSALRYRPGSASFPYPKSRIGEKTVPSRVKSNKGGKSFPLGILAPSPRSSSKNG